jgi:hypothetical protein
MRRNLRKLENKARKSGHLEQFKKCLTEYNKEIRKSKRNSWKNFCEDVADTPTISKVRKFLCKDHCNEIGTLKRSDGSLTRNVEETLELLMQSHFPDSSQYLRDPEEASRQYSHFNSELKETYCLALKNFRCTQN